MLCLLYLFWAILSAHIISRSSYSKPHASCYLPEAATTTRKNITKPCPSLDIKIRTYDTVDFMRAKIYGPATRYNTVSLYDYYMRNFGYVSYGLSMTGISVRKLHA